MLCAISQLNEPETSESDALSNCATGAYINIFFKQLI